MSVKTMAFCLKPVGPEPVATNSAPAQPPRIVMADGASPLLGEVGALLAVFESPTGVADNVNLGPPPVLLADTVATAPW